MKQEYKTGSRVTFKVWSVYYDANGDEHYFDQQLEGVIVGYKQDGYLKPVGKFGIKRYKIQLDDSSILFMGASRLKLIKEK